jgi:VWFA-related protein
MSRITSLISAGAVAVLGVHSLAAPGGQQQPFRVDTSLVRVDVYPTSDGQIVTGLQASEFEVLEDGVAQKIETFEHVAVTSGPYTARREPSSQREMNQALANPRSRVFLIFLDAPNVDWENARAIREPLAKFLRDYLGDDDLVAVMTPGMSASQLTFGRKTDVIEAGLRGTWDWGRRNREMDPELDKRLIQYGMCYPNTDVGGKMIARARERITFEAMQDAVKHLHNIREERKAIVAITEGWPLYREDRDLMRKRDREFPIGVDPIVAGPNGKLTTENKRDNVNTLPPDQCDHDRAFLASIDDEKFLREIIEDANRGNASFYMIDPGGLRVSRGAVRSSAMRTLAENTDGAALLNANDLDKGFKRMADDMSSYYLLGYYATNSKPDGRFRTITVRVKRPGIAVRARRGYRAPTSGEITEARAPDKAVNAEVGSVLTAIERLGRIRPDARFRVNASTTSGQTAVWVAGELESTGGRPDEFLEGSTALVEVVAQGTSVSTKAVLKPGERTFLVKLDLAAPSSGVLDVRARLISDDGTAAPLTDGVRIDLAQAPVHPLLFRRGPTTGNRLLPAGNSRFSRMERVQIEIPAGPDPAGSKVVGARVIDRGGLTTKVPVTLGERTDEVSGQRWMTASVNPAALSPGDYVIELRLQRSGSEERILSAVRIER